MNFKNLITNGTGFSIKNFFLFGVLFVGVILLLTVSFVLVWDVTHNGAVGSSISELSGFVAAVSAMFVSAGLPKIVGDIMENKNKDNNGSSTK